MNWVGRIKHNTQQIPLETKDEKNHSIKMKGLSMGMTSPVLIPIKCADIVIASRFFRIYDIYKIGESGTIRKEKWLYYMLKILQIQFQHCNSAFCFKEKSFTLVALRNILAHRAPETPSEHLFYTHQKKEPSLQPLPGLSHSNLFPNNNNKPSGFRQTQWHNFPTLKAK